MRAGYISLKRHGEAIEEREDEFMPVEQPEMVKDGLRMMTDEMGVPLAAVARKMCVQPKLLRDLLGDEEDANDAKVVNLFAMA